MASIGRINIAFAVIFLFLVPVRPAAASDCITVFHYDDQGNVLRTSKHGEICKDERNDPIPDKAYLDSSTNKKDKPPRAPNKVPPVPRQIVVADPSEQLVKQLHRYSLRKVDGEHLPTLDVTIIVLRIVPGRTVEKVIRELRKAFPGIVVDLHHTYDLSRAGKKGKRGTMFGVLKGIDWLAAARVYVVNMSIAGPGNGIFSYVLRKGIKKRLVMVAAARNGGPSAKPAWPAAHPQVASITAIDRRISVYRYANRGSYIDFAAPGVNVPTPLRSGRAFKTGTSFASPYVAAMTAMLVAQGRQRDMGILRQRLKRYVIDLGKPAETRFSAGAWCAPVRPARAA